MGPSSVLLVEDDDRVRGLLRAFLENDYEILEARDAATATAICRSRAPGAVLLDLRLPDDDGLGLLERLRAHTPRLPVIVLTGLDNTTTAELAWSGDGTPFARICSSLRALRPAARRIVPDISGEERG